MPLDFTGSQQSPAERESERDRLLKIFEENGMHIQMTEPERNFVADMEISPWVSPRQLQWLRAIKDKYL